VDLHALTGDDAPTNADPTLVELAGLKPVPSCTGDPDPSVHCLHGRSYASAFGVGSTPAREFAIHQWPYADYAQPKAQPHTANPTIGAGTMAYGIRTARYRYIVNTHYDSTRYQPEWGRGNVSKQLYDYQADQHETINLAANASYRGTMDALHTQLRSALDEG
jgi:hypothetical protein